MTARARTLRRAAAALWALNMTTLAHAISWDVNSALGTSISHTDNVALAPAGEERRETVLAVSPSVSILGNGSHVDLEFLYGVDALFHLGDLNYDGSRQLLRGDVRGTIEENFAYVDASTWLRRQPIDPDATDGLGDIAISETAGTGYHSVSTIKPYFRHAFGTFATVQTGLAFDYVNYSGLGRDSYGREISASAESGVALPRVRWSAGASHKDVIYPGETSDFTVQTINLSMMYQFYANWSVLGQAGYLNYDFVRRELVEESPGGTTWRVGLAYMPSQTATVSFGAGAHYYGTLRFLGANYIGTSTTFAATWDETVTTRREVELLLNADDESEVSDSPQAPIGDAFQTHENAEVYISELGTLSAGFHTDRIAVGGTIRSERRRFETRTGKEYVRGGNGSFELHLSPRTSAVYTYAISEFEDINDVVDVRTDAKLALVRRASERMTMGADVQRVQRNYRGTVGRDYISHVYSVRVEMRF